MTTHYIVDDRNPTGYAQVLQEKTGSDPGTATVTKKYVWGRRLMSQTLTSTGITYYYLHDGHGSTRALVNGSTITDTYDYDAFGNKLSTSTSSTDNNYLYSGGQFDPTVNLYLLGARYYSPQTGRFWTIDAYEGDRDDPLSIHKYLYCAGSPISRIDPSGHDGEEISTITAGSLSAGLGSVSAAATVTAETAAEISIISSETVAEVNVAREALEAAFGAQNSAAVGRAFNTFGRIAETAARNVIKLG